MHRHSPALDDFAARNGLATVRQLCEGGVAVAPNRTDTVVVDVIVSGVTGRADEGEAAVDATAAGRGGTDGGGHDT